MQLNLVDFLSVARGLRKEDLLVVASDHVTTQHGLWLADHFEDLLVERGLHDTVVELDDKHVLVETAESLRDELCALNLVIIESTAEPFHIFGGSSDRHSFRVHSGHHL